MAEFISPKQVYDDPKLWLSVPHTLHESLGRLMKMCFPDWENKLKESKVHCLECEGKKNFKVGVITRGTVELCTGYVGEKPDEILLRTVPIEAEKEGVHV